MQLALWRSALLYMCETSLNQAVWVFFTLSVAGKKYNFSIVVNTYTSNGVEGNIICNNIITCDHRVFLFEHGSG